MKTFRNTLIGTGAALGLLISVQVSAQQGPGRGPQARDSQTSETGTRPGTLSEEQRNELKAARLEQQKQTNEVQLQLAEKRARLNSLQAADKPDARAINSVIDEIATLQAKQMKAKAAFDIKFREMLTPEQRIRHDAARIGFGREGGRDQSLGRRQGQGRVMDMQRGPKRAMGMQRGQGRGMMLRNGQGFQNRFGAGAQAPGGGAGTPSNR
jgi:Spy/CpxP family protein refolding chaperone